MLSVIAKNKILSELYTEEDYRQFAYDDATGETIRAPKGNLTIGIGWNIQVNGCPRSIAEYACMYFVNAVDTELSKKLDFYNALDEVRKVALCDMGFNMGINGLLKFDKTLDCIRRGDYRSAAISMLCSTWAKMVGKRAVKLSAMMESGQWS